jgi:hypothetical protein
MPHRIPAAIVLACAVAAAPIAAAQNTSPPSSSTASSPKPDPNKPVTMNGCVTRDSSSAKVYTFTDSSGFKYRLSGQDVSKYVGQTLEIVGVMDTKRLKVKGGLLPSPNIAAQAGAIDPGKAHVAELGGGTSASGNPDLPTFRVAQINAAKGECPK